VPRPSVSLQACKYLLLTFHCRTPSMTSKNTPTTITSVAGWLSPDGGRWYYWAGRRGNALLWNDCRHQAAWWRVSAIVASCDISGPLGDHGRALSWYGVAVQHLSLKHVYYCGNLRDSGIVYAAPMCINDLCDSNGMCIFFIMSVSSVTMAGERMAYLACCASVCVALLF